MHSALAVTYEMYDTAKATAELATQIREKVTLLPNSCGILFAEPEYDWSALLEGLRDELGITVVGCSASAQLSSQGYHTLSASLLVLTADDCVFATGITPPLGKNGEEDVRRAYAEARATMGDVEPEIVMVFSSQSPSFADDALVAVLNDLAGGKPVFGAIASDYFEFVNTRVFCGTHSCEGGISFILAGGNIKPKFTMRNIPRNRLGKSIITRSEGKLVYTIDGIRAYDYMVQHGMDTKSPLGAFFTPLVVEPTLEEGDVEALCITFPIVDKEKGTCTAFTHLAEGAQVSVQVLQGDDILKSTREAMESIVEKMNEDTPPGYTYSTVLGVTCAARHVVLAFDQGREGELAKEILPPHINFAGFYSHGEFCPMLTADNKMRARMNNLSFGLCVF